MSCTVSKYIGQLMDSSSYDKKIKLVNNLDDNGALLLVWSMWGHRNYIIFNNSPSSVVVVEMISIEAECWRVTASVRGCI